MFFRRQHNHEQQDTDEVVFDNQMAAFTFLQPTDKESRPRLVRFCSPNPKFRSILASLLSTIFTLAILLGFISTFMATIHNFRYNLKKTQSVARNQYLTLHRYSPSACTRPACSDNPELCPGRTICEPIPLRLFSTVDAVVIYIFTIEYLAKLMTCWAVSPRFTRNSQNQTSSLSWRKFWCVCCAESLRSSPKIPKTLTIIRQLTILCLRLTFVTSSHSEISWIWLQSYHITYFSG